MNNAILSLHPTFSCQNNCVGCYLKKEKVAGQEEKPVDFFLQLIGVAKNLGFEEVALAVNLDNFSDEQPNGRLFYLIESKCAEVGIRFSITTNYQFFYDDLDEKFINIGLMNRTDLVSISINEFVTPSPEDITIALSVMKELKTKVRRVNCNILLSESMCSKLNKGLMKDVLDSADTVYLLLNKPTNMSHDEVSMMFLKLLEKYSDNEKIIIDSCVRYTNDLTGGICDRHNTVYINPYGELRVCPYASNGQKVKLAIAKDLEKAYNEVRKQMVEIPCQHLFCEGPNGSGKK